MRPEEAEKLKMIIQIQRTAKLLTLLGCGKIRFVPIHSNSKNLDNERN